MWPLLIAQDLPLYLTNSKYCFQMDNDLFYSSTLDILERSNQFSFLQECIIEMKNGTVMIGPKAELDKDEALEIYRDRFRIQNELWSKSKIEGFDSLMKNLNLIDATRVFVQKISCSHAAYIIFSTNEILLGLLKTPNSSVKDQKKLISIYRDKEVEFSGKFYTKGEFQSQ